MVTRKWVLWTLPTEISSDLAKLTLMCDVALKHIRRALIKANFDLPQKKEKCHLQTIDGRYSYNPGESCPPRNQTLNYVEPWLISFAKRLHDENKEEWGHRSPCLRPLELMKKPAELPLIKTENFTTEIHQVIYEHHFSQIPRLIKYSRKSQLTWSLAFSMYRCIESPRC